jgi:hypothetical protein
MAYWLLTDGREGVNQRKQEVSMRFLIATALLVSSLGVSAAAQAGEKVHSSKDWVWSHSADSKVQYAATTNAAGNFIGLYCFTEVEGDNCVYQAQLGPVCKEGDRYPAILNAPSGSAPLELTCRSDNVLAISPFKAIDDAIRNNRTVSIAVPADGSFTVSRFSLAGSTAAITAMSSALARDAESPQTSPQAAFVRL